MQNDKRKALGRGLDALLPSTKTATATVAAERSDHAGPGQEIAIDLIDRNPYQTRGRVDEASLNELTASIRASGVLQPILVRPITRGRFQLMAGERRWMAAGRAGKQTIPAIVKQASDEQAMEITIVENLQREDLNAMEQARAYERLAREFGMTQEKMAQRTGKDRASVANFLRLLKLPAQVQQAIEQGQLSFGHGKVLMMLAESPEVLDKVAARVIRQALSVRATEELVHGVTNGDSKENKKQNTRMRDPNVRAAEEELQRSLGLRVEIKDRGAKGKIVLHYASLEDFDRVLETLGPRR